MWDRFLPRMGLAAVIGIVAVAGPLASGDGYLVHLMALATTYAVAAMSLNLLVGVSGQISLSHAAFFGLGAYATAILGTRGVPFWLTVLAGIVAGAAGGVALGIPALRLRGHYLGMVTLGFGQIVSIVLVNWVDVTGGANGIPGVPSPSLLGWAPANDREYLPLVVTAAVLCYLGLWAVDRSSLGLQLKAIRDDDVAAASIGVPTARLKLFAFVASSAIAAFAGSLFVGLLGVASPESFNIGQSILFLVMVVVGGLGSFGGAVVGAVIITLAPEYLRGLDQWYRFAFGAVVVVLAMFLPSGLAGLAATGWTRIRLLARRAAP
jgi:ABC-type branched-subunit amino acid transport system permease subunit